MFTHIGKKMQTLAQIICWAGITVSVIGACVLWSADSYRNPTIATGFIVLVVGALVSWIGSWTLYAFGQITEDIHAMREASDTSVCLPLYRKARELMAQEQYAQAVAQLEDVSTFRDADKLMQECYFHIGSDHFIKGELAQALEALKKADEHPGAPEMCNEVIYLQAKALLEAGNKKEAARLLNDIRDYKDVEQLFQSDDELRNIAFNLQSN